MFKLRNHFINTTSMLLAPPNEGEEDTRSEAQKARDAVNMNDSTENNDDNKDDDNEEEKEEGEDEEDKDENEEDEEDDSDDNKEDEEKEDKEKEETEEEKIARLAAEKEERREKRVQKRIDKAVAAQKAAEARAEAAEAKLKETPVEGLTEEEVQRRAEALAATKLTEKQIKDAKKAFEDNCDKLEDAATKSDKNFPRAVNELTTELGPIPSVIINTLIDLDNDNGGEVLAYLAKNVDEAEDLYDLRDNERKLTIKLTRISDKLKEEKKPARRSPSNVPAPIDTVSGSTRETSVRITGKETQEEFNAKRAKQEEARRAQRGY